MSGENTLIDTPTLPGEGLVLIPFGNRCLALTAEQLGQALQRGRQLTGAPTPTPAAPDDRIVDAAGMEAATAIPASWWLEQARRQRVPHLRCGKYVRFRLGEALASQAVKERPEDTDRRAVGSKNGAPAQRLARRRDRVVTTNRQAG